MTKHPLSLAFAVLIILVLTTQAAYATAYPSCGAGHWYYKNTATPMIEAGGAQLTLNHDNQFQTIISSCDDELNPSAAVLKYDVFWRQLFTIKESTVPVGTQFEVEFATLKSGIVKVHHLVKRKVRSTGLSERNPQRDEFGVFFAALEGNNGYRIRIRLIGTGSGYIKLENIFATAQGSRSEHGNATATIAPVTINSVWQDIGSVTINNTSGGDVDVQLQANLTLASGTPGQRLMIAFGKNGGSAGSHYAFTYVSQILPESVTVYDYMPNEGVGDALIPVGQTTFRLWARVDSGSVQISSGIVDALAMSANPSADTARMYTIAQGPTTHSEDTTAPQPQACIQNDQPNAPGFLACNQTTTLPQSYTPFWGKWSKVLEMTIPANAKWIASVGGGYVEILARSCKTGTTCWDGRTQAQVAIEIVTNEPEGSRKATDFHMSTFSIGTAPTHVYFFEDAFNWGNSVGNTVRLWVRLVDHNPPAEIVRQITVGRRYLGIRFFEPTGDMYYPQ